ncbi:HMG box-containing protein 5 isoform X1 [Neodiprion pinetum]|uniref:Transcription factor A, mitochondrial n=1 Tax=Neodiprion lecontei TaxID=441921 RepID=A0ABM3FJ24_NEOLC|nr:transcription factor A, mitochondrial isoform X1 [Neodiprion pinetum]XP_046588033.1 transcription factor A, mitochondrial [Neodiprion lecontei]
MAMNGNFFKLCNVMGPYRNLLSSRFILPSYQPVATLKHSLEERLGLSPKPKRPLSVYFTFMQQLRPMLRQKYPDLKSPEIVAMIAKEYKKMDPSQKSKLEEERKNLYKEYSKAMINYENSITDEQKELIKKAKRDEAEKKLKRMERKSRSQQLKSLGIPTRPPSAYSLFARAAAEKRGSMKIRDWQTNMLQKWKALSDEERQAYETEAAKSMKEFKESMRLWKERMKERGEDESLSLAKKLGSGKTGSKHCSE